MLKIPAKLVASSTPTTQSKFLLKQFFLRRNRGKHRGERGFKELIPVGWGTAGPSVKEHFLGMCVLRS